MWTEHRRIEFQRLNRLMHKLALLENSSGAIGTILESVMIAKEFVGDGVNIDERIKRKPFMEFLGEEATKEVKP